MPVNPAEIIRPATSADIPSLSALFRSAFGHERPPEIWAWKFYSNPFGNYSYMCEVNGEAVAHCGGTPITVLDGSRRYTALQLGDFCASPTYPGGIGSGGVFARTVREFFGRYGGPQIPLVYGFAGERHRVFGERILKYVNVEPIGQLTLEPEAEGGELVELSARNLALLSQAPPPVGGLREMRYAKWRYLDHPTFRYFAVVEKRWWRPAEAIAIVRDTGDAIMLLELEGSYQLPVLQRIVRRLRRLGKPVMAWGSLEHPRSKAMAAAGFAVAPRDHRFDLRIFTERPVFKPGEYYYSLGDYDVY